MDLVVRLAASNNRFGTDVRCTPDSQRRRTLARRGIGALDSVTRIPFAYCFVLVIAGCAPDDGGKQMILEAVRRDSAAYCSELSKEGCEFSVGTSPEGWAVMALPILRSENGERSYAPGVFQTYSYSKEGRLLGTMPGL
jgi:hypothetical protein